MFNNLNKTLKKAIISFLIITLTYSNFVLIGTSVVKGLFSYALEEVEETLEEKVVVEQELVTNKVYEIDGAKKRIIQVLVTTGIEEENYPIKLSHIILKTNIIDETPEDIKVAELNKNSYTVGTYEISEEKLLINLENENEELENKESGLDKLLITYVFPYVDVEENEVIDETEKVEEVEQLIKKPVEKLEIQTYSKEETSTIYEDANFEDVSNKTDILLLNIENKDIHKTTIVDGSVEYTQKLNLDLSYRNDNTNILIEDISNEFYNNDELVNEEPSVKYIKSKFNRDVLVNLLGEEGKLTLTDADTNKTIVELIKQNIEEQELNEKVEYSSTNTINSVENVEIEEVIKNEVVIESEEIIENEIEETTEEVVAPQKISEEVVEEEIKETTAYVTITKENVEVEYALEVSKIQVKIENILKQSNEKIETANLILENTKNISNVSDIEKLNYLKENVKYTLGEEKTKESKITFKDTITRARLEADKEELTIGQTNNVQYTITLDTEKEKSELFVNPIFVLELPASVTNVNKENSSFSIINDNNVFTNSEVLISSLLGKQYVVIISDGEQTLETIANGNTQILLSLELNVSEEIEEGQETVKLYYQNGTVTAYESGEGFNTVEKEVKLVLNNQKQNEVVENGEQETNNSPENELDKENFAIPDAVIEVQTNEITEMVDLYGNITLQIKIINKGLADSGNINLNLNIPKEIMVMEISGMTRDLTTQEIYNRFGMSGINNYNVNLQIPANHEYTIQFNCEHVNKLIEDKNITINGNVNDTKLTWETILKRDENLMKIYEEEVL